MHSSNIRFGRRVGAGVLVGAALLLLSLALFQAPDRQDAGVAPVERPLADVPAAYIAFEENRGQSDPAVHFLSRGERYQLYLTAQEVVMVLEPGAYGGTERDVVRFQWQGTASDGVFRGHDALPTTSRYYRGSDPQQWVSDIASYRSVEYQQLYPGVDLIFHSRQGELEYDFVVAPGTDPSVVKLNIEGAEALQLNEAGDLLITTPTGGTLVQRAPLIYQQGPDGREPIEGRYALADEHLVAFNLGAYDSERALVIDPVLSYSSYLGGSDDESGAVVAADAAGNLYVAARTRSIDFPVAGNSHVADDYDIVLTKLGPSNNVLRSTYFGGSGRNIADDVTPLDAAQGIAVSADGNDVYVVGYTSTTDFPTPNAFLGTGQGLGGYGPGGTFGGGNADGYLTRFDTANLDMVYSTYLGGVDSDRVNSVAIDGMGDVYVAGVTSSLDYPQVKGFDLDFWGLDTAASLVACGSAANPTICGDAFVSKLSYPNQTLSIVYSTLFGGVELDAGKAIAVDASNAVYITGMTQSLAASSVPPVVVAVTDAFPVKGGAVQAESGGLGDAFISKISFDALTGTLSLDYSDFIGGTLFDSGEGIALNSPIGGDPNAYVVGMAFSADFPVNNPVQGSFGGGQSDVFVTKITADGGRSYSTYLGGSADDRGLAIAVRSDTTNNALSHVYVTGFTGSADYPVKNALRLRYGGGVSDAFVAKLTDSGGAPSLAYSTYLGGSGAETGGGIVIDPIATPQQVVVVGDTASADFDTQGASAQSSSSGQNDLFLTRIADSGAEADLSVQLEAAPDLGIIEQGDQVSFQLTVANSATSDTATDVVVVNVLQPGGAFVSAVPEQGSCTHISGEVFCNVGNIAAGSSVSIEITVRANSAGTPETVAQIVKAAVSDPDLSNNAVATSIKVGVAGGGGGGGGGAVHGSALFVVAGLAAFTMVARRRRAAEKRQETR